MTNECATAAAGPVRVGVDVGGTFTDVALTTDRGDLVTAKVPTSDDQSEGVMEAIEKACTAAGVSTGAVDEFTHATTVSVNALLERAGAKIALVTTAGFRDVLEIGRQDRPELYDLDAEKSAPLVPRRRRFEVDERATIHGIARKIDLGVVDTLVKECTEREIESVAVAFLHAYAHPENEQRLVERLRERLDVPVSASHEVLAEFREYERTSTTVVDAYVAPVIDSYLGRLESRAEAIDVPSPHVMQSNGGLASATTVRRRPVTTVMSGPAAGVVGARFVGSSIETDHDLNGFVTFDMGGTSSDVSLIRRGEVEWTTDAHVAALPIGTPMVDVHTVGSGGGSIAWMDAGGALRVGPRSAGANPGPACYGRGGTRPTVTDANLCLGYIGDETTLGGEVPLDPDAARDALADLVNEGDLSSVDEAARGVHRVANATMTRAIRAVTVERGRDPRSFGLVAFGGAGPIHAVSLAERLEIRTVVVPFACGVLSAFGLLSADERYDAARTHHRKLSNTSEVAVSHIYRALEESVREQILGRETVHVQRQADLRYDGQSFEITVPVAEKADFEDVREQFQAAHERTYGYRLDDPVELVTLRITATVPRSMETLSHDRTGEPDATSRTVTFESETRTARVYDRASLPVGFEFDGPTIVEQEESTTVVPPGWAGTVRTDGTIVLVQEASR